VVFDGEVLHFPWCYDDRAVKQVRKNLDYVRKYLGAYAPKDLHIEPIIVVPGWFVAPTGKDFGREGDECKIPCGIFEEGPEVVRA